MISVSTLMIPPGLPREPSELGSEKRRNSEISSQQEPRGVGRGALGSSPGPALHRPRATKHPTIIIWGTEPMEYAVW